MPSLIPHAIVTAILGAALSASAQSPSPTRPFVVEEVFAGRSEGHGTLRLGLGRPRSFAVHSEGAAAPDERFRLDQDVQFDGKPSRRRTWVLWATGGGHYSATLTDAAGPVVAHTEDNRMILRYPLTRWGLTMCQTLVLQDAHTVINTGRIRLLGIPVGALHEVIQLGTETRQ